MSQSNLSTTNFDSNRKVGNAVQPCPVVWIEIELLYEDKQPVSGEEYRIQLADGKIIEGTLNSKGFARHEGIVQGDCKISFPKLDPDTWKRA
jgi:hypothetical protein